MCFVPRPIGPCLHLTRSGQGHLKLILRLWILCVCPLCVYFDKLFGPIDFCALIADLLLVTDGESQIGTLNMRSSLLKLQN